MCKRPAAPTVRGALFFAVMKMSIPLAKRDRTVSRYKVDGWSATVQCALYRVSPDMAQKLKTLLEVEVLAIHAHVCRDVGWSRA